MKSGLRINNKTILISWYKNKLLDTHIPQLFAVWKHDVSDPDCVINIRRNNDGCLLKTPHITLSCRDEKELISNLEYSLTLLSQDFYSDNMQIHASCIDYNGKGALFVAPHGYGKTTLALTAISSGLKALTDDVAIINKDLRHVSGFPRPFKASDYIQNMKPCIIPENCPHVKVFDDLTYVFFYSAPTPYYAESTQLKHIIFPVRRDGAVEIREIGETEAMRNILTQGFNYCDQKDVCVEHLLLLLRNAPPLEISYGDHWDAIDTVRRLLAD